MQGPVAIAGSCCYSLIEKFAAVSQAVVVHTVEDFQHHDSDRGVGQPLAAELVLDIMPYGGVAESDLNWFVVFPNN